MKLRDWPAPRSIRQHLLVNLDHEGRNKIELVGSLKYERRLGDVELDYVE